MNRRTWLLLSTALLAALAIFGMVNAASASLPTGSSTAALPAAVSGSSVQSAGVGAPSKDDPLGIANFNCADISRYSVDKQTNVRAAAILQKCGYAPKSSPSSGSGSGSGSILKPFSPLLGGVDADVILPDGTSPHITQSETFVWAHGNTVVSTYNDSRTAPACYSGGSYSLDGGATWIMLATRPFCTGHGTGFGDPTVVWDNAHSLWVASFLASGCGGQGVGAWNSPDGINWTARGCVLSSSQGDRNSSWVDNNPASSHYGTVYVSYNDFNVGGGALYVGRSTDAGVTWASAQLNPAFIRDVQITGAADSVGTVLEAAMNENGGGLGNRNNVFYRSTDGGVTWTLAYTGPAFRGPGRAAAGYFAGMFTSPSAYWRHMGWGQPAGGGPQIGGQNVFHYDYSMGVVSPADPGNVMYIRSTDNGTTWSTAVQLNQDTTTLAQWMPSLTETSSGALLATWYDERSGPCGSAGAVTPCWQRYGRVSLDNGATWQAEAPIGDAISPLPAQPDPNVQPLYAGDYDYSSSDGNNSYTCWDDGRVLINGASQQDVFCDKANLAVGTPTPTVTGTPPTQTRTSTVTNTATATATPCSAPGVITNGGFETGSLPPWVVLGTNPPPVVSNALPHSGTYSALLGSLSGTEPTGDGSMYQTITVPASGGTLSYWWNGQTTDTITFDWQDAYVTNTSGTILATIQHQCATTPGWVNQTFNMAPYAGQTVRIEFLVHQDGFGDDTSMYVDDVALLTACSSPTPGTPPTNTPTRTATSIGATATATACTGGGGWSAGPVLPVVGLVRAVGNYFPANGNFYTTGGRTSDAAGADFQHVLQFTPSTGIWVQKGVTLPDNQMNNMACGVLTVSGTPYIYCVGGSAATQTTATARVFRYDPVGDAATVLTGDNWPGDGAGTILPGGFAVANNKLYILGGFNINVASTNQIWEFDPTAGVGSKWTQKINAPAGLMYAPAATIGGVIYVGGASDYQGGTVVDTNLSFSFNPTANTIGTIATIPRATGETRAVVVGGLMWVLGGGRVTPNPSNEVDVYNPGTNTWSTAGPAFGTARRNFPADSDPATGRVWLAGGYATDGVTPLNTMEIFTPPSVCASPTPPGATNTATAVNTATRTATAVNTVAASNTPTTAPTSAAGSPSATRTTAPTSAAGSPTSTATVGSPTATFTACPIQFTDVPNGSTFYPYIRCLACRGIVSGYADGTFRPNNNVTRGQLSKIVSNSAGFSENHTTQDFQDVPVGSNFYIWIERLYSRGIIGGYPCGGPFEPCGPGNLPYFRPNANATRGQITKIDANAAGYNDPPVGQQFQDVPPGSTFYTYTYQLVTRGIMSGYPCSGPGEPCVPPGNLPYFRPNNNATRGQTAKIVANTFFPNCQTPSRPVDIKDAKPAQVNQ